MFVGVEWVFESVVLYRYGDDLPGERGGVAREKRERERQISGED